MIDIRNFHTKLFILVIVLVIGISNANSQTLTNYAKKHKAELVEKQKAEKEAYESACKKGTMDALKTFIDNYPKSQYAKDVKSRISEIEKKEEQDMYDYAARVETTQAYQAYLKKYPNGKYAKEAKGRIEDMELWQNAKKINTIAAYKDYISKTNNKSFLQMANDAITDLESREEWQQIVLSPSKRDVEAFINKYPKSSVLNEAQKKLYEYKGVEYYNADSLLLAYNAFEAAGGRNSLTSENRSKYDKCYEFIEYQNLSSSSSVSTLLAFLNKYPHSRYYNQVSNYVAVSKAKSLSMFSTSNSFDDALSYAKDKDTRTIVQDYIDNSKKLSRIHKKNERRARIKANGGVVQFGWEIIDMGFGCFDSKNEGLMSFFYNMGFGIKFGNYKSPVQLELGIKPGIAVAKYTDYVYYSYYSPYSSYYNYYDYNSYNHNYGYEVDESVVYFHMPIHAKLKLNLFSIGNSKFYLAGIGAYNAVRKNEVENEFSAGAGAGFAWKRWDLFLYYKQDIADKIYRNNRILGTSLIAYF